MLHQFKDMLPSGASMAHLNIKTPKDTDWFAQGNALQQMQNLDSFGGRLNASVVVHPDSEDAQVSLATRERNSRVRIVKGDMYFVKESGMTKNVIRITEFGGLDLSQQYLDFRGDNIFWCFDIEMCYGGT
jgi:hypothetical protein